MLPSRGYFSGTSCVFFSDGGCRRPHCHYRHSYQDVASGDVGLKPQGTSPTAEPISESSGLDQSGWSPGQVTLVTRMVENAVDKALRSDSMTPTTPSRSALVKNTLDKLLADPKALEMTYKRKPTCQVESVPAYKPTPISKLTAKHIPVSFLPETPYPTARGNRANSFEPEATSLIEQIISSKTKAKKSASENRQRSLTSNPEEPNRQFHKEPHLNRGFYRKHVPELAEDNQHSHPHNVDWCKIPRTRSSEFNSTNQNFSEGSSASKVSSTGTNQSSKKSKLNTKNTTSSVRGSKHLAGTDSLTIQAPFESKVQVISAFKGGNNSAADTEAAARNEEGKGRGIAKNSNRFDSWEPPAKRKKSGGHVALQVSSSTDPFSRWMKNIKIRQILGKDKKLNGSRDMPTAAALPAQETCHTKIPSTKVRPSDEELPEPKISKSIAHQQDQIRPVPITAEDVKIPSAFRHHFCAAFFEAFKQTMNLDEARRKAAQKEFQVALSSKTPKTYKNNCSLLVVKYRKGNMKDVKLKQEDFTPSSCPQFTYGWSLYKSFSSYLLSESELRDYGFPLAVPDKPNCAFVDNSSRSYSIRQTDKPFHKICANCSVEFQIDGIGFPTTVDDCFYHWGKLRKIQYKGQTVEKFTCCGGSADSTPCEISAYHVWSDRDEDCMEGFVETTKLPTHMEDHEAGVYALDCEMCYTTGGLELARLTVLDLNGLAVFDEVVSITNPILNYCTRFSGIDARKMASATHTFGDVRRWILDHFYDKTILIGHSLENDLKALKLIHRAVVDTSVTFPHKFGPPNKMSLKHLANVVLELDIQENTDGHDSKEDATTCLKLMMRKIREDSKARKPRVIIGYNGKKK